MREIVQFYYMWKKSERGDINFAKSDTVDHMDIYLNEGGDFANNSANVGQTNLSTTNAAAPPLSTTFAARRSSTGQQNAKSFSIMTGGGNNNNNIVTAHSSSNHMQSLNNINNIATSPTSQTNKLQNRRKTVNSSLLPPDSCVNIIANSSVTCGK